MKGPLQIQSTKTVQLLEEMCQQSWWPTSTPSLPSTVNFKIEDARHLFSEGLSQDARQSSLQWTWLCGTCLLCLAAKSQIWQTSISYQGQCGVGKKHPGPNRLQASPEASCQRRTWSQRWCLQYSLMRLALLVGLWKLTWNLTWRNTKMGRYKCIKFLLSPNKHWMALPCSYSRVGCSSLLWNGRRKSDRNFIATASISCFVFVPPHTTLLYSPFSDQQAEANPFLVGSSWVR